MRLHDGIDPTARMHAPSDEPMMRHVTRPRAFSPSRLDHTMPTFRTRLPAIAALSLLSLTVGTAARAQERSVARATAAPAHAQLLAPIVVTAVASEPDDPFALDDALLHGIPVADWQAQRIVALRRLQLAEATAARPQLRDAVAAMRRASDRGDDETARAIFALLHSTAAQAQTFRLAALRALLTPDQLPRFDANVDELMEREPPALADDPQSRPAQPLRPAPPVR